VDQIRGVHHLPAQSLLTRSSIRCFVGCVNAPPFQCGEQFSRAESGGIPKSGREPAVHKKRPGWISVPVIVWCDELSGNVARSARAGIWAASSMRSICDANPSGSYGNSSAIAGLRTLA